MIHAVGPVWSGGNRGRGGAAGRLLSRRARSRGRQHALTSIAFPAISTGVYRFPPTSRRASRSAPSLPRSPPHPRGIAQRDLLLLRARKRGASQGGVRGIGAGLVRPPLAGERRASNLRLHVQPHDPVLQPRLRRRIDFQAPPDRGPARCGGANVASFNSVL